MAPPEPQSDPRPDGAARGGRATRGDGPDARRGDDGPGTTGPESRTGRRAARSARVRRRRRILLGIGGALVVIVLAFVLWYELESHALGSPGPQVVVTVQQGESTGLRHQRAEPART